MKTSVLSQIKKVKEKLVNDGGAPDTLILSIEGYHKLHKALQEMSGREILILKEFEGLKIMVHPLCSDDQIHIIDSNCFLNIFPTNEDFQK